MATAVLEKRGAQETPKMKKAAQAKQAFAGKGSLSKKATASVGLLSPPKTAQMNVRIDAELKKAGDDAFARIGLTPSTAVRTLWEFAAHNANDPQALRGLLSSLIGELEAPREEESPFDAMEKIRQDIDKFFADQGIERNPLPEDDDERLVYYDTLREEALWERLEERGLLS